jgi:FkbH-like protein
MTLAAWGNPNWGPTPMRTAPAKAPEPVRLLIWDLDDTFWSGTLMEGGVKIIESNVRIVKTLAARGIISSICSKNDLQKARSELERIGLWEYFVFPRIAWAGKGAMVKAIAESVQLRPATILFIDDNPINLNEVRHYNPEVQLADPGLLAAILDDQRFAGKDDAGLTRLAQYKVLEKKELDQIQYGDSNADFLRNSEIQISFHHDVLGAFDRIHELINRTNQLNFTKRRISENREAARAEIEKNLDVPWTRAAYIKASDKYGVYGIVGFYMNTLPTDGWKLEHFLFSCRILNMGLEQFVYRLLSSPRLEISGEVVSDVHAGTVIDWITVVEDAGQRDEMAKSASKRVCMRGACDLDQLTHYLGHRFKIKAEFPYPYKGVLVAYSAPQFASIYDELAKPENQRLMDELPFLHHGILESAVFTGEADAFVQSFAIEEQWSYFRHKPSGLVLPTRLALQAQVSAENLTTLSYAQVEPLTRMQFSEDGWRWFQENFEYAGGFDPARFERGIRDLLARLRGKQVIIVLSNTRHGRDHKGLEVNAAMNAIIERVATPFAPQFIRMDDLITGDHEVTDANHFARSMFPRLSDALKKLLDSESPSGQ